MSSLSLIASANASRWNTVPNFSSSSIEAISKSASSASLHDPSGEVARGGGHEQPPSRLDRLASRTVAKSEETGPAQRWASSAMTRSKAGTRPSSNALPISVRTGRWRTPLGTGASPQECGDFLGVGCDREPEFTGVPHRRRRGQRRFHRNTPAGSRNRPFCWRPPVQRLLANDSDGTRTRVR